MRKEDYIVEIFSKYINDYSTLKEDKDKDNDKDKNKDNDKDKVNYSSLIKTDPSVRFSITAEKSRSIVKNLQITPFMSTNSTTDSKDSAFRGASIVTRWMSMAPFLSDLILSREKQSVFFISKLDVQRTAELVKMILLTSLKAKVLEIQEPIKVLVTELEKDDKMKKQYGDDYLTKFKLE
jgi:hypothetical protein